MLNRRQASSSVTKYLNQFKELMLRCDIKEELQLTLHRFVSGLREDTKREVNYICTETLNDAHHKALEMEKYFCHSIPRRGPSSLSIIPHE